jgi:hypothetical protein
MLLHHDEMPSSEARRLHLNNDVIELHHGPEAKNPLKYEPSDALHNTLVGDIDPPKMNIFEKFKMKDKLDEYQTYARKHVKDQETEPKKYWDAGQGKAVKNRKREAEVNKMVKEKRKASAASSSGPKMKTPRPNVKGGGHE